MRNVLRCAAMLIGLGVLGAGCLEEPAPLVGLPPAAGDAATPSPRVLVVNTLSETLSSLDPDTGTMTVQAAVAGTWVNRIGAVPGGRRLLLTNSGANEVQILDALDLDPLAAIDLGPGRSPWTAVAVDGFRVLVTNWLSGTVRLGTVSGVAIGVPLPTTAGPEGVVIRNGVAWIACTNYRASGDWGPGRVDVVDVDSWIVLGSVPVGANPQDLLFAADGRLHVVCTGTPTPVPGGAGEVYVIDPATRTVEATVPIGGSPGRLVLDSSDTIWTVGYEGGLRDYDSVTLARRPDPVDETLRSSGLSAVAFDPVRDALFVTHFEADLLLEVDRATAAVKDAWLVGDGPVDVLVYGRE